MLRRAKKKNKNPQWSSSTDKHRVPAPSKEATQQAHQTLALQCLADVNCTSIVPTIGPWEPKKEKIGKEERQTEGVMRLRLNKYVVKQYQTDWPLSLLLPETPLLTSIAKKRPYCNRHDLNICISCL